MRLKCKIGHPSPYLCCDFLEEPSVAKLQVALLGSCSGPQGMHAFSHGTNAPAARATLKPTHSWGSPPPSLAQAHPRHWPSSRPWPRHRLELAQRGHSLPEAPLHSGCSQDLGSREVTGFQGRASTVPHPARYEVATLHPACRDKAVAHGLPHSRSTRHTAKVGRGLV